MVINIDVYFVHVIRKKQNERKCESMFIRSWRAQTFGQIFVVCQIRIGIAIELNEWREKNSPFSNHKRKTKLCVANYGDVFMRMCVKSVWKLKINAHQIDEPITCYICSCMLCNWRNKPAILLDEILIRKVDCQQQIPSQTVSSVFKKLINQNGRKKIFLQLALI